MDVENELFRMHKSKARTGGAKSSAKARRRIKKLYTISLTQQAEARETASFTRVHQKTLNTIDRLQATVWDFFKKKKKRRFATNSGIFKSYETAK